MDLASRKKFGGLHLAARAMDVSVAGGWCAVGACSRATNRGSRAGTHSWAGQPPDPLPRANR